MKTIFDGSAIGSDVPRSLKQYVARMCAKAFVKMTGLNYPNVFSTEIVQAINPVEKIRTRRGPLLCVCGHGRLLWRARTFFTEEPQTVEWLDTLKKDDILWDVGANVGLYSIYAAKFAGCKVIAFEPESQNYSLLVKNIVLNNVESLCLPSNVAIANGSNMGHLNVRYITQGGAYNMFESMGRSGGNGDLLAEKDGKGTVDGDELHLIRQIVHGVSLDELVTQYDFDPPTHLKIDVDGLEPRIIDGSFRLLGLRSLKSILIEINRNSERDLLIPELLKQHGFELVSERSNWLSRDDRTREKEMPTTNMIFAR